jgi:hypothetical protein
VVLGLSKHFEFSLQEIDGIKFLEEHRASSIEETKDLPETSSTHGLLLANFGCFVFTDTLIYDHLLPNTSSKKFMFLRINSGIFLGVWILQFYYVIVACFAMFFTYLICCFYVFSRSLRYTKHLLEVRMTTTMVYIPPWVCTTTNSNPVSEVWLQFGFIIKEMALIQALTPLKLDGM